MRRVAQVLLAAAMAALALLAVKPLIVDEPRVDPYLQFVTAHLDVIGSRPVASSDARFSRAMAKVIDLDHVDPALDACAGPVAVLLGDEHPVLVVEHDYCGGSGWISKLAANDVVQLSGPGIDEGLYTTEVVKYVPRYDSTVEDLPQADVVLQTCVSRSEMVLVGLVRQH